MNVQDFLSNPLILIGAAMFFLGPRKWHTIGLVLAGAGIVTTTGVLGSVAGAVGPQPTPTGDLPQAPVEDGGLNDIFGTGGIA